MASAFITVIPHSKATRNADFRNYITGAAIARHHFARVYIWHVIVADQGACHQYVCMHTTEARRGAVVSTDIFSEKTM